MGIRKTKEQFIKDSKEVHGNRYNYDEVNYVNNRTKIKLICYKHGKFWVTPGNHISQKCGCTKCSNKFDPKANIIDTFLKVHKNKYNYSLVNYTNNITKIKIICPDHGLFLQTPNAHTNGNGCPLCKKYKPIKQLAEYLDDFNTIHNNFYDYSKTKILGAEEKCIVICPRHGEFLVTPANHRLKKGCPKCALGQQTSKGEKEVLTYIKSIYSDKIIENSKKIINPYELDIFLPDLNLAIEYNGYYWHNKREKEMPGYHKLKAKLCKSKNIRLINISDINWNKNQSSYKEKLHKIITSYGA